MVSTLSTTPNERFAALEVTTHRIERQPKAYHVESSSVCDGMAALTEVVAQLSHDNNMQTNYEEFDKALAKPCQTSTVREYQTQFEHLAVRVHNLSKQALVESYIGGLKEEIRSEIKIYWPTSLLPKYQPKRGGDLG